MVQMIGVADVKVRIDCASSFIRRAVNQQRYARLNQSAGAHRARFDRRVNHRIRQSVVAEFPRGFAQCDNLSMGRRIAIHARAIPGNSVQFPIDDDAGSNRNLARGFRLARRTNRFAHPVLVRGARFNTHFNCYG